MSVRQWILIVLSIVLTATVDAEVWYQTDWSGGLGIFPRDSNSFSFEESIDWWSSPGEIRLSRWVLALHHPYNDVPITKCLFTSSQDWVYAGTIGHGVLGFPWGHGIFIHRSPDPTFTWYWIRHPFEDSMGVYSIAEWNGDLYAGCRVYGTDGVIFKSTDDGWTWFQVGERSSDIFPMRLLGFKEALWMSCDSLYKSTDGGESWEQVNSPSNAKKMFVCGENLWVGGSGVYLTTDGGESWECKLDKGVRSLVEADGVIYAFCGFPGPDSIYKTEDLGEKWDFFAAGPESFSGWLEEAGGNLYLVDAAYWISPEYAKVYQFTDGDWQQIGCLRSWFQELLCSTSDSLGNLYLSGVAELHPDQIDPPYAADHIAKMVKEEEVERGSLISYRYHSSDIRRWGVIKWRGEGLVKVRVRTGITGADIYGKRWSECDFAENGSDISSLNSVSDWDTIIQYRVSLYKTRSCMDPCLEEIYIEYNPTEVEEEEIVKSLVEPKLFQNKPNPFSQQTAISYQLSAPSRVNLRIYDTSGRVVRTLVDGIREAGFYTNFWDGRDQEGKEVPAGVYFYQLKTQGLTTTRKLVVVR